MGDPRRIRKKYSRPRHPWEGGRIENEKVLMKEYGLNNKKEIWKMDSLLTSFKDQVKKLNAMEGEQAEKEKQQLMNRLVALGVIEKGTPLDDVLGLNINSVMERRLQSVVQREGLAKTMKQARQFVIHEHVTVDGKKVTVPSYLVRVGQQVGFSSGSALSDEMHPERVEEQPASDRIEKKKKQDKKDEEEALAYKEDELLDDEEVVVKEGKKKAPEETEDKKKDSEEEASEDKKKEEKKDKKEEKAEEEPKKEDAGEEAAEEKEESGDKKKEAEE